MSESNFERYVVRGMGDSWHSTHHEDKFHKGIGDRSYAYNFSDGWMELKFRIAWPVRPQTNVTFPKFYPEQRLWLKLRGRHSNKIFFFVKVGKDYLLFDTKEATIDLLGRVNKKKLISMALKVWHNRINFDEFKEFL